MLNPRILVITGAGISAESRIPTFRGTGGYWRNLDPTKLATPEAFARDPQLVWDWYRERRMKIREAQPNDGHIAITRLSQRCPDFLLVTQNVDDLHRRAQHDGKSISPGQMVQIHGDIFLTRCSRCDHGYREADTDNIGVPRCPVCGAMMRPGVVWFGESLDLQRIQVVENFLSDAPCDVVLVIGTTAMFGYIVDWALRGTGDHGRLIEINPDTTAVSAFATKSISKPAGEVLPDLVTELLG